ncbi:MAG: energy-coupling factor ABC transporter ATP-binding protein [Desulfuromonadales bacterium]|nr:energy-coupling factor ABC transporter ATP-binding protein [Desulfuromonadales bacterium]
MSALYQLKDIGRRYGTRPVLDIDSLQLQAGRLYTLTGANGSGKTTLLQILAFLQPPNSGNLIFRGLPVTWSRGVLRQLRREVTLLHQSPYLFATSVYANVTFGLRSRGIRGEKLRRAAMAALETCGLSGFEGRSARELSGGEAQRVAMARALALQPAVLLLDEPLANVDSETSSLLLQVIRSLPKAGTSVIMTTHDPRHQSDLNSITIHLENGCVVSNATSSHSGIL